MKGLQPARRAALALSLAVCACGSGAAGPQPPRDLRIGEDVFDELSVTWAAAPDAVQDSVWIELSFDGGPFYRRGEFAAPRNVATLPLGTDSRELARVEVRARTARPTSNGKGTDWSDWSTASFQRGIRPPTITATRADVNGAAVVRLTWTTRSAVADALSIERTETPVDGSAPVVVTLPVPADAQSWDDADVSARRLYRYRLRSGRGGVWSTPAVSDEVLITVARPWDLVVEHVPEGVRVSWDPLLDTTVSQHLDGAPGRVGVIPASATSWIDTRVPPWPTQAYELYVSGRDSRGDFASTVSRWVKVPAFTFESEGARFAAYELDCPEAPIARAPDGTWWLAYGRTLTRQTATGWEVLPAASDFFGSIVFDQATPHRLSSDTMDTFLHEWWTGGPAWNREQIPVPSNGMSSEQTFAFGSDGAIHVLYSRGYEERVFHVTRSGDSWTEEELPTPAGMRLVGHRVAIAADGTRYAAVEPSYIDPRFRGIVFCSRPPAQPWSCVSTDVGGTLLGLFAMRDGPMALVQHLELTAVSFQDGGWTTHAARAIDDHGARALAMSPDGARVAVLAFGLDWTSEARGPLRLLTFDGSAWTDRVIAPIANVSTSSSRLSVGFVAGRLSATCSGANGTAAWEEQ